ncbi:MAG: PEP-CTERM sorting domain-containing protein [Alphaproteobacteria bacterium]|nr:PEP-CTERM sorting domain-containing protein [Alphaproteobacteria bacterium]
MRRSFAIALAGVALVAASAAQAGPLLFVHDADNTLGTVDVATGDVTIIGTMNMVGDEAITDIAFDPDGNLFSVSFDNFYSINKNTGAATLIGAHGVSGPNALVFRSDGTIFTAGFRDTNLSTIDVNTGVATTAFDMGFGSAGDLAFHDGKFYLAARIIGADNELVEIDLDAPSATSIGSFGFDAVFGLATGSDGIILYGLAGTDVFKVDTLTGAGFDPVDYAGQGMTDSFGTSFFTEAGATIGVPEPATVTLVGLGLFGVAWRARRSRPAAG